MIIKLTSVTTILALIVLLAPATAQAQAPACEFEYTVQAGDWLSRIAEKYYGDVLAYPAIVEANNAQAGDTYPDIANADLIEPGWLLCIPSDGEASTGPQPAPEGLSEQELGNATYKGIYEQPVTLVDGTYEGEPFVEGGASRPTVVLVVGTPVAYGDLTGDGQDDAAVLLAENSGGSGVFTYLAVVVNQNGQPVNVATTLLGDRVKINSMTIENGEVVIDLVQAGPDDPLCCPTQRVIKTYQLQGEQLVETSSQEAAGDSSPALAGPIWRWDQTVMNNGDTVVPDNPNNYNLQFLPDGTVSIQADCNQVGGTYTVDGSSITIETGPTTLVACPPGSLGDQFVADLNAAAIYFIEGQNLFIDLQFDSGTMRFTAQSTELAGTSWIVTGYNNGQQAVVSVIIGTEMTATFGADGQITGSAGCNDYFAAYTTEGNNISIGPAGATRKLCPEPEGIMEQEQQFLAALQTAATYTIRGDTLDLRTADGARAVAFQAAN